MIKARGMAIATKGFTLIEWVLYFFLILLVLTVIFHFSATVQQQLVHWGRRSDALSQLCVVQDLFSRDLSCAPIDLKQWDVVTSENIAWWQKNVRISWEFHEGTLVRVEKDSNQSTNKRSRKKSVIARNITEVRFAPHYKKNTILEFDKVIQSISCLLKMVVANRTLELERTVLLRNRVLG